MDLEHSTTGESAEDAAEDAMDEKPTEGRTSLPLNEYRLALKEALASQSQKFPQLTAKLTSAVSAILVPYEAGKSSLDLSQIGEMVGLLESKLMGVRKDDPDKKTEILSLAILSNIFRFSAFRLGISEYALEREIDMKLMGRDVGLNERSQRMGERLKKNSEIFTDTERADRLSKILSANHPPEHRLHERRLNDLLDMTSRKALPVVIAPTAPARAARPAGTQKPFIGVMGRPNLDPRIVAAKERAERLGGLIQEPGSAAARLRGGNAPSAKDVGEKPRVERAPPVINRVPVLPASVVPRNKEKPQWQSGLAALAPFLPPASPADGAANSKQDPPIDEAAAPKAVAPPTPEEIAAQEYASWNIEDWRALPGSDAALARAHQELAVRDARIAALELALSQAHDALETAAAQLAAQVKEATAPLHQRIAKLEGALPSAAQPLPSSQVNEALPEGPVTERPVNSLSTKNVLEAVGGINEAWGNLNRVGKRYQMPNAATLFHQSEKTLPWIRMGREGFMRVFAERLNTSPEMLASREVRSALDKVKAAYEAYYDAREREAAGPEAGQAA